MSAIPADIFKTATDLFPGNAWNPLTVDVVARAILAERERCAKLIEDHAVSRGYAGDPHGGGYLVKRTNPSWSAQVFAAAIRNATP